MKKSYSTKFSLALACAALTSSMAFAQAELTQITPAPGSYFSNNTEKYVNVFFNPSTVTIESAKIIYTPAGDTQTVSETLSVAQDQYRPGNPWDIGATIDENSIFFYIGTQKAALGSMVTVVLENVTDNGVPVTSSAINSTDIVFEDGNILINYYVPSVRFQLTEQEWPGTFYADWSLTDESPLAVLTFNEDIKSVGSISYRTDNSEYGSEGGNEDADYGELPLSLCTVNENIVTLDFSEVNLTFITPQKVLSVYVTGIESVTGQTLESVPTGHMSYVDNSDENTAVEGLQTETGEAVYYNLQGVKVNSPAQGQMVIKIQNGKASKILVK